MAHGRIKYVPRWLYKSIVLPPGGTEDVEPTIFVNDTIWDWRPEHFSFYVPQAADNYGGTATLVDARVGMSGQSDINLVRAQLGILAGNINRRRLVTQSAGVHMLYHELKHPFRLPKDGGFQVRVTHHIDMWGIDEDTGGVGGFVAFGRGVNTNKPVMFAGETSFDQAPAEAEIHSVDLNNDGREDVDVHTLGFKESQEKTFGYSSYQVNPITGPQWIPGEYEVPLPLLSPYSFFAAENSGSYTFNTPLSYEFPNNTVIKRRQEVRIRMKNNDTTNNVLVHMALFGYLEVK